MALLEEEPDRIVVLVRHREVGVVPVHPIPKANGLVGLHCRKAPHSLLARFDKSINPERFDIALRGESLFLFDFDFNPQPLAVEALLEPQLVALHRLEAIEQVFVCPAPRMMDTHRAIRRDRPVNETPFRLAPVFLDQKVKSVVFLPEGEDASFKRGKVNVGTDG